MTTSMLVLAASALVLALSGGIVETMHIDIGCTTVDDGNAWVAFGRFENGRRRAFAVTSEGFEAVWYPSIEEVPGQNHQEMEYKTVETDYETLEEIAREIAGQNSINHEVDQAPSHGIGFVIDLVLRVVSPEAKAELLKSSNNWPMPIQLLDHHYFQRLGESAFTKRDIPRGTVPHWQRSAQTLRQALDEKRANAPAIHASR